MKKLLGTSLALALIVFSSPAHAELLKNFKMGGQIDLQATSADNVTDFATRAENPPGGKTNNDRIGDVQTRLMLNTDWDLLDDVHSKVSIYKNDRTWGTPGGNPIPPPLGTNAQPLLSGAGSGVANNIFISQAAFKIDKIGGQVDATFGRQYFGNSGDMIIYFGPTDKASYGLSVNSIDAIRADWSSDKVAVTGLFGKQSGHTLGPVGAGGSNVGDVDLRGVTAMLKGQENLSAGVYLWNTLTHANGARGADPTTAGAVGGKNDNLYIIGAKGKWTSGGLWLSGEFAKNFGDNRVPEAVILAGNTAGGAHYTGWGLKANAGDKLDVSGVGAVTPWAEFAYGTGRKRAWDNQNANFTAISPDYRPGGIYGRFAIANTFGSAVPGLLGAMGNSTSLGNRVIWGLGAKVNPSSVSKLTAGLSYWDYRLQTLTTQPNSPAPFGGNNHLGSEFDIDATWQHSENVAFNLGVGDFLPGGLIKNANAAGNQGINNPAKLAYLDLRVKF